MTKPSTYWMKKLLPGIVIAMLYSPLIATAKPLPLLINEKIHNLEAILSHAARKHDNEAEFARIHHMLEEAEVALKAEDTATAEKLYSEAWEAYQAAVKTAQAQDHKENREKRVAAKTASVKALLKQFEEIDKGEEGKKSEQIENVKSLLAQAEAAEDPAKALTLANQAYYMMKILVKDVRHGKTLTLDRASATPAQKYADETAYNDMHFGLLDVALEQLHVQADAEYNNLVNNAKELRHQAEEAAEHNDFESAMSSLALSTKEIKKALKHIGLAVPGL